MSRKSKYSYSFKLQAVQKVIKGNCSYPQLSLSLGVHQSLLRKWVSYYEHHSRSGLERHNNRYSSEFKLQVITAYHRENLSLSSACLRFHIPSISVLKNWLNKYNDQGEAGLLIETRGKKVMSPKKGSKKASKPKTREQELEEQLEYLKLENLYLKKLHALIQQEEKEELEKLKKQSSSQN